MMILVLVFEDNPTALWIAIQASPNLRVRFREVQSRSYVDYPFQTIRRMKPEGSYLFLVKSFVQLMHAVLGKCWADVSACASLFRCMHTSASPIVFCRFFCTLLSEPSKFEHLNNVLTVDDYRY